MEQIDYHIESEKELSTACMPFIKNGGLFIKTIKNYPLGEIISVSVKIINDIESLTFQGKVVWVTPPHEDHNFAQGIGIQFPETSAQSIREFIEKHLPNAFSEKGMLG